MRTIRFMLHKEFRQILRDHTMLRLLLVVPIVQLLVLSSAATFEVKNGLLFVVDQDHSTLSRGLVDRVVASGHFTVTGSSHSMAVAEDALLDRSAAVVLRIPADFQRELARTGEAPVQLVLDAQDAAAAGILASYLTEITQRYAGELGATLPVEARGPAMAPVEVRHRGWFNPELIYTDYMVPGILVLLVTIVSLAIMSMNIVREKEIGTLEQLNVTPLTRGQFVAGKLIPFWVIAVVDLSLGLVVAKLVFDIPMVGSLTLVFLGAVIYLFVTLGIGLWISTVVDTQQQAIFVAFTVNMIFLLMSGLFTPIASMPGWARVVAELSPPKHFIEVMRAVLIKGAGFGETALPMLILTVYGAAVFILAARQHSKTTA